MAGIRVGPKTTAQVLLGVTAVLLTLGVLWPLLALDSRSRSAEDAHQAAAASNHFALPAALVSQTMFPPKRPGAVLPPSGVVGDSGDNVLVLALSSTAFLFLATLPLLLVRKFRHFGKLRQPHRASLVGRILPAAP